MPFRVKLGRTKKYEVWTKNNQVMCVEMLDGSLREFSSTADGTAQDFLNIITQKMEIAQTDMFGLRYTDRQLQLRWLDLNKSLHKQLDKFGAPDTSLYFGVQGYIKDISTIVDENARYQYYLQLRSDFLNEKFQCSLDHLVLLASLSMQIEHGDFSGQPDIDDLLAHFPKPNNNSDLEVIVSHLSYSYERLLGTSTSEAVVAYLVNAVEMPLNDTDSHYRHSLSAESYNSMHKTDGCESSHIVQHMHYDDINNPTRFPEEPFYENGEVLKSLNVNGSDVCRRPPSYRASPDYNAVMRQRGRNLMSGDSAPEAQNFIHNGRPDNTSDYEHQSDVIQFPQLLSVSQSSLPLTQQLLQSQWHNLALVQASSTDKSPVVRRPIGRANSLNIHATHSTPNLLAVPFSACSPIIYAEPPPYQSTPDLGPTKSADFHSAATANQDLSFRPDLVHANSMLLPYDGSHSNRHPSIHPRSNFFDPPYENLPFKTQDAMRLSARSEDRGLSLNFNKSKSLDNNFYDPGTTLDIDNPPPVPPRTHSKEINATNVLYNPKLLLQKPQFENAKSNSSVANSWPSRSFSSVKGNSSWLDNDSVMDPNKSTITHLSSASADSTISNRSNQDERSQLLLNKLEEGQVFVEFENIPKKSVRCECSVASLPENRNRNRFKDVHPYDGNRVQIKASAENRSGYINASHIRMTIAGDLRWYLASQGPLPDTILDFWNMIWQHNVDTIAMLTGIQEEGKCAVYWPNNCENKKCQFGDYIISLHFVRPTSSMNHTTRGFHVQHIPTGKERLIMQLQFSDWAEQGCPTGPQDFLGLLDELESLRRHSMMEGGADGCKRPLLVHCSAGVGRTGVLLLADIMKNCLQFNLNVDMATVLRQLRTQRMHLVQTLNQYTFVYKVLIHSLSNARLI